MLLTNLRFCTFIALKIKYGDREIRELSRYNLTSINGGHQLKYSGILWLDYSKNPNNKSSLSIDSRYSLNDGLSAYNDINILLPTFNDKVNENFLNCIQKKIY